jgi:hypothetical protein
MTAIDEEHKAQSSEEFQFDWIFGQVCRKLDVKSILKQDPNQPGTTKFDCEGPLGLMFKEFRDEKKCK